MSVAVSVAELVLAVVFAVSGAAKLLDRAGTQRAVVELEGPAQLAPAIAVVLPVVELGIAATLITPASARWSAVAALALLLVFCVAIGRALARGAAPDCNCFGGLAQTRIGRGTLARNAVLGALAALAAFGAGAEAPGAFAWIGHLPGQDRVAPAVIAAMALVIAGLAWLCWQLLRQNGRLLLRLDAQEAALVQGGSVLDVHGFARPLAPGAAVPDFVREDLEGHTVSLESLLAPGLPVTVLFTDPNCGACQAALAAAARVERERADEVTLAVVSRGNRGLMAERARELGLLQVVHDGDGTLFRAFRIAGAPTALTIDPFGRIGAGAAVGADAARELVAAAGVLPQLEVATR